MTCHIWECPWTHNDLTGRKKIYKIIPNKGNEVPVVARSQRSRAVSEQKTRNESQRPGEKWRE